MSKYHENEKALPILTPADIVATATNTQYVDLNYAAGLVEIDLQFGAIASTDSTGEVVVSLTVNPVSDTSSSDSVETAIAFNYRLSAAVATDTMGAITAATSSGAAIGNTSDNVLFSAFVETSAVAAAYDGARFIRATITPTSETTSTIVGGVARFTPRFAQNSMPSST